MTEPDPWIRDEDRFRIFVFSIACLAAVACAVAVVCRFVHFLFSF